MEGRLTARELQVLELIARGRTDTEIGRALTISLHTVNAHNRSIFRKLGVRNRVMAARYYQLVLRPAPAGAEPLRLAIPDARRAAT